MYVCFYLCVYIIQVLFNFGLNLSMKIFFFYLKKCVIISLLYGHDFKFTLTTFV